MSNCLQNISENCTANAILQKTFEYFLPHDLLQNCSTYLYHFIILIDVILFKSDTILIEIIALKKWRNYNKPTINV